jgi:hypothetical protein
MPSAKRFVLLAGVLSIFAFGHPQDAVSAAQVQQKDSQAVQLLRRALATLVGSAIINDADFSGTVRRIAGSNDASGSASLEAAANGQISVTFNLSSGTLKWSRSTSEGPPSGNWTGLDGVSHDVAGHNLMTPPCWFYPAFTLNTILSDEKYGLRYIGQEYVNGKMVDDIFAYKQPLSEGFQSAAAFEEHLSELHIFLDGATSLPLTLTFNEHPDNDAGVDIPVRVEFSDFRSMDGATVPFHVQKFINNSLVLDLQFETVKFNTGFAANSSRAN